MTTHTVPSSTSAAPPAPRWTTDGPVVAIVPAKDRAATIGSTIDALLAVVAVDRIVVVDDGSTDGTAESARLAAARNPGPPGAAARVSVVRLDRNQGKAAAVAAGVVAAPDAGVYVLVDADLEGVAAVAAAVAAPVLAGTADMTIGVPTAAAGRRGGFGLVRSMARYGIARASGFTATAPLSGQRAVAGGLMRELVADPGERFGIETALTIDAVRAGARVVEVPVSFEHEHRGRSLAGFGHRARQGVDIVRALWPRLTTARFRLTLLGVVAFLTAVFFLVSGTRWEPSSSPATEKADHVVIFSMSRLALSDIGSGATPTLDRLWREGAVAATSVRTRAARPTTTEGFASLGAGDRIRAGNDAADAFAPDDKVGLVTAAEAAEVRTGVAPRGEVVVVGAAITQRINTGTYQDSAPGALGDAIHAAGRTTAVVGNADTGLVAQDSSGVFTRPAAVAVMDATGSVDLGDVDTDLLVKDPSVPFAVRADPDSFLAAARRVIPAAAVTVLDPGDLDRVAVFKPQTVDDRAEQLRQDALRRTDALLGQVVADLPPRTLLIVTAVRPVTGVWALTPTVLWGAGVRTGYAHSPSTRRLGLITITDLAPTVLDALSIPVPDAMIGHALRYHPGPVSIGRLESMNSLATYRERIYLPLTKGYVIFQALLYVLAIVFFSLRGGMGRVAVPMEWIMLAIAGLPLATFVFRMIPHTWALGPAGTAAIIALDFAIVAVARLARRSPLSPLGLILGATVALTVFDLATGARLQQSSVLGYSPHTAARFTGIGNAAFAALAACTTLWAAIHIQYAPRRREAWWTVVCVCVLVVIADGAPFLGSDVGGILTLVPVFGLLLYSLSGRRVSLKSVLVAGGASAAALVVATGLDLLRPAQSRTHLGRFVTDVFSSSDHASTFDTTIMRKLTTNVRVFTGSFWTWMVPIIAVVLLFFLVGQRGWERDMPRGSALRAGVIAVLVAGLVGFAVNDSGTVVAALVFVYLGPFITLLALARPTDERELAVRALADRRIAEPAIAEARGP